MCGTCGCDDPSVMGAPARPRLAARPAASVRLARPLAAAAAPARGAAPTLPPSVLADELVVRALAPDLGQGPAPTDGHGRLVHVERNILDKNDRLAGENRRRFADAGVFVVNLMSSPGSGKTTLLVETLRRLAGAVPTAVIEGDQHTAIDAARIRATGTRAVQLNTGRACHLDAGMVRHALDALGALEPGYLFVENVGNLVCPASFDLGEGARVVVASIAEGEDKPLKYPHMFSIADLVVVSKVDLAPALEFPLEALRENVARVAPHAELLEVSSRTGAGLELWLEWLVRARAAAAVVEAHVEAHVGPPPALARRGEG
jgi:hydrogenase nickel incorporation protein HypB